MDNFWGHNRKSVKPFLCLGVPKGMVIIMEKEQSSSKRLLLLLKPFTKKIVFICCCLIASTVINLFIPIINKKIMDEGLINRDYNIIFKFSLLLLIMYCFNFIIKMIKEKKRVIIEADLRSSLFYSAYKHLLKMSVNYFDNKNSDEVFSNINNDVGNITAIAKDDIFFTIAQLFNIIGGVTGLILIDYKLALLISAFIPVKFAIVKIIAKKRKNYFNGYIQEMENNAKFWGDSVNGINEIKIFGIEKFKQNNLNALLKKVANFTRKIDYLNEANMELDNILLQVIMFMIYVFGGLLVINDTMSVGTIFAFITYSSYIVEPISAIMNIGYYLSGVIPSANRYFKFMDHQEEMCGSEKILNTSVLAIDICFCNVCFKYDTICVLQNLNFNIFSGKKMAIIGENGSGKTTLLNLILRLRTPTSGKILIGNRNISEISIEEYRSLFSVVSQKIYLFNDTIINNICLYKRIDKGVVRNVLNICGLQDFVDKVSLDYIVGAEGTMLSGGQKQKIALARALVQDTPFIIFDEITSNVDAISAKQINSLLLTYLKEKTVLLVTHNLNTLQDIDSIVVLKDGEINEIGSYSHLVKNNGYFKKILESTMWFKSTEV